MCGIAGFVATSDRYSLDSWASQALASLRHRGPDDEGDIQFVGGRIVHCRLAILDLTECGHQPMSSPDGKTVLAYNGEIVNYQELRETLERDHGVRFKGHSDSEVLLHAWLTWGEACLDRLVGMFAFVILDTEANTLKLVRDPVGIKPLYTVSTSAGTAFASEITPLLTWPGVSRQADPQNVVDYLRFGYTDHLEQTLFHDVKQVPAGTVTEVDLSNPDRHTTRAFWTPSVLERTRLSRQDAVQALRDLLTESVAQHLRSDVPVASCLSGGIDSSSIVMLMRHIAGSKAEIHTFSHLATGSDIDEKPWVDIVVEASGAISHTVESQPSQLMADMENLLRRQEQPFISTSVFAQYRLMEAIQSAGLKVTLDGQGADELFGGYAFHVGARLGSLIRQSRWTEAWKLLKGASVQSGSWRDHSQTMLDYCLGGRLRTWGRSLAGRSLEPSWLNAKYMARHDVHPDPYRTAASRELLREAMVRSLKGPGLPHLLRYEDRNSMAFSVESRVPFITRPLIDFALSLPEEFLVDEKGQTKSLLREAMRGIVPDTVLDRKDKIAFQTPEADWLDQLAPDIERILSSEPARRVAPLDTSHSLQAWRDGASPASVWRWVNLIEWTRLFDVTYS